MMRLLLGDDFTDRLILNILLLLLHYLATAAFRKCLFQLGRPEQTPDQVDTQ